MKQRIEIQDVISLADLAERFSRASGMEGLGKWLRGTEGEGAGNSLAILKALRAFNEVNPRPIQVFKVVGYDGTNKPTLVIAKSNIIRLKGYIQRGGAKTRGRSPKGVEFQVLEEVQV